MSNDGERGKYKSPDGSKMWEYLAVFLCKDSLKIVFLNILGNLLTLCVGIVLGWNAPGVVLLISPDSPIPFTSSDISTLTAVMSVGNMLAPLISMFILDTIGRKYTLLLSGLPLIVGWSMIMMAKSVLVSLTFLFIIKLNCNIYDLFTHHFEVMNVARFLSGISLGLGLMSSALYCGEISSVKTRGASVSILGIMFTIGILMSYILVPYLSMIKAAGIFLFLSVCFVVLFSFMPESPYYLAMKGRNEEAEQVLEKLLGKTDVSEELAMVLESLVTQENTKSTKSTTWTILKDILMVKGHRRALFIIFLILIIMQCGGFVTMLMYGQLIFHETTSTISDYTVNVVVGIALVLSSILTILLVDKLGRKPFIFVSGIMVGFCTLTMAVYFYAKDYLITDMSSNILVSFVAPILLVFFGNAGFSNIVFILNSEIFAIEVKAIASCICGIFNGLISTIVSKLYIHIAITLNYGHAYPFFVFCIVTWFTTALLLRLLPETKGKSFKEIQKEFQS
ncbi:PREDICTED: facilitated trehalose transporter Tret1-like [Polistes dominula]|uniref:Facilitated trehalose transporter Tret1-like n=1 Tax=Polistes dominula TaxID=743375 RepID=A0ABM1J5G5_POLDO|nr:PREDICTED: facilitated trehalose transporter Tret1-like [Polistes dominula]